MMQWSGHLFLIELTQIDIWNVTIFVCKLCWYIWKEIDTDIHIYVVPNTIFTSMSF